MKKIIVIFISTHHWLIFELKKICIMYHTMQNLKYDDEMWFDMLGYFRIEKCNFKHGYVVKVGSHSKVIMKLASPYILQFKFSASI
jgi:hypothetical protein